MVEEEVKAQPTNKQKPSSRGTSRDKPKKLSQTEQPIINQTVITQVTQVAQVQVQERAKDNEPEPKTQTELDTTMHSERQVSVSDPVDDKKADFVDTEETTNINEIVLDNLDCKILCCRVDPTDKFIAAACEDGRVRIYEADTGKKYKEIRFSDNVENVEMALRWRPNADPSMTQYVLAAGDTVGSIYHVHVTSGKILHTIEQEGNEIYTIDYSYDATKFATGGMNKEVRVYDEHKKSVYEVLKAGYDNPQHNNRVLAVKFSKDDPNLLLSAGWDNCIIRWDLRTKRSTGYIFGPQVYGEALDIQGDYILAGSSRENKQIQIFDVRTTKTVSSYDWDQNPEINKRAYVYSAQFGKCNKSLVGTAATGVNQIKIFNHQDNFSLLQKVNKGEKAVYCLDFFHQSNNYVYCGNKGALGIVSYEGVSNP